MKVVRLNPSWEWACSVLLRIVENSPDSQAKEEAKQEILRAARSLDKLLAKHTNYFEEKEIEVTDNP